MERALALGHDRLDDGLRQGRAFDGKRVRFANAPRMGVWRWMIACHQKTSERLL
jgi:hypothetical protein